jgi:uncharacterized membrane protein YfcA
VLEVLRTAGYSAAGFDYRQYVPEILVATVTGLAGTYLGKRATPIIPDHVFRAALRLFISVLGIRSMQKGTVGWTA